VRMNVSERDSICGVAFLCLSLCKTPAMPLFSSCLPLLSSACPYPSLLLLHKAFSPHACFPLTKKNLRALRVSPLHLAAPRSAAYYAFPLVLSLPCRPASCVPPSTYPHHRQRHGVTPDDAGGGRTAWQTNYQRTVWRLLPSFPACAANGGRRRYQPVCRILAHSLFCWRCVRGRVCCCGG